MSVWRDSEDPLSRLDRLAADIRVAVAIGKSHGVTEELLDRELARYGVAGKIRVRQSALRHLQRRLARERREHDAHVEGLRAKIARGERLRVFERQAARALGLLPAEGGRT